MEHFLVFAGKNGRNMKSFKGFYRDETAAIEAIAGFLNTETWVEVWDYDSESGSYKLIRKEQNSEAE